MNTQEAILILREKGYSVVPPKSEDGVCFILKFTDPKTKKERVSLRKNRYNGYITEWPEDTKIAKIVYDELEWKPLNEDK